MRVFLPNVEVATINQELCQRLGAQDGFSTGGAERLEAALNSIQDADIWEVGADLFIALSNCRPFLALNEATAFGALNATLALNMRAIRPGPIPMDLLLSRGWEGGERSSLIAWLREVVIPAPASGHRIQ